MQRKEIALIGYSGHSYVVIDAFLSQNQRVTSYCEMKRNDLNPFKLDYLGVENHEDTIDLLRKFDYFIGIGDNTIRRNIYLKLVSALSFDPINAIHKTAVIADNSEIGNGVLIAGNATINPLSRIGNGVICNTGSIIEHENTLGDFVHIGPGAVLCGNVKVGSGSFIGANAVVKEGVIIGNNVLIGAGSVVIRNIPDNSKVVGNPQRQL